MDPAAPAPRLDPGRFGFTQDRLPPLDHGPLDLRGFFGFPAAGPGPTSAPGSGAEPGVNTVSPPAAGPRPLELEIGSGKGTFLVQQARHQPGTDFLGIEYAGAFWRHAADRVRRHGLENVRLLHADATVFVRNFVPPGSLAVVHLYFPDPWPKARHHKRRSFCAAFLRDLHPRLAPGGELRVATDHADYFAWMRDHAAQVDALYQRRAFVPPVSAAAGELVGTNFERKYRDQGRSFNAMTLVRRPDADVP